MFALFPNNRCVCSIVLVCCPILKEQSYRSVESEMSIDASLLASLEGPDPIVTLSQAVEKNPEDFDSWTKLLGKMDDQVLVSVPSVTTRI